MLNKSEIAILTIAVSIGSQNYFKMKQCRHFMQITYSPNNVLITMSCRLRGGCERLRDETAHGILPVDPTALSWTFRWSPHHRSNRPYEPPHNLVRPTVGNSGILPRLPDRIPTRHYWRCLGDLPCCPVILRVQIRRFRCVNDTCPRRTFGEPLP